MLKYVGAAGAVFVVAHFVSTGLQNAGTFEKQATAVADLPALLDEAVVVLNKEVGTKTGGATFSGASRIGNTVVIELTMKNPPKRYDANAAAENLLQQVKPRWCGRKTYPVLRQGGAVIYRYQTEGGLVMFDAKVDAQVCNSPT